MFFCKNCHHLLNIKKILPNKSETGYFFCDACGYNEKIDNTTLIFQSKKISDTKSLEPEYSVLDIYQRKYIKKCTNKKCTSKNDTEVVIYKDNNFNVQYICTTCKTII